MYLNKNIADKIIHELKDTIEFHINIINSNGFIIASTDFKRIDSYHEASLIVIKNQYEELIVEYDEQYKGCRTGVNLPVFFSKELVGVVGITGEPSIVVKYARIIKKMTEMLIYEQFDFWHRTSEEQVKLLFANDLINGNFQSSLFKIEERLNKNNLNVKGPYTIALIKYANQEKLNNSMLNEAKHTIVKNYIIDKLNYKNSLIVYNGELFIVITNLEVADITREIEYLCIKVEELYGVSLLGSIGNTYDFYGNIPNSYNEAVSTIESLNKEKGVYPFNKVFLDIIISKIPENYKNNLRNQVFAKCEKKEVQEFTIFIKDYFILNGSLNLLAEKHYIHKNTVQYKIQKIKEKTDYDLRVFREMLILYLASLF